MIHPILKLVFSNILFLCRISETEESKMAKTSANKKTNTRRGIEKCCCADIGISSMAECLQPGPCSCSYAIPFGYCFLCRHPRVNEIISNTKKLQLMSAAALK